MYDEFIIDCDTCDGSCYVDDLECLECDGTGELEIDEYHPRHEEILMAEAAHNYMISTDRFR